MSEDVQKTLMTKKLAGAWLRKISSVEHRVDIIWGPRGIGQLGGTLRAFRDKRVAFTNAPCVPDLGVKELPDKISLWSADREKLAALNAWLERRGYETSGVW